MVDRLKLAAAATFAAFMNVSGPGPAQAADANDKCAHPGNAADQMIAERMQLLDAAFNEADTTYHLFDGRTYQLKSGNTVGIADYYRDSLHDLVCMDGSASNAKAQLFNKVAGILGGTMDVVINRDNANEAAHTMKARFSALPFNDGEIQRYNTLRNAALKL